MTLKSDGQIFDFCEAWRNNTTPKKQLCKQFSEENWNYFQFEKVAKKYNWFVDTMYALVHAEEFSSN